MSFPAFAQAHMDPKKSAEIPAQLPVPFSYPGQRYVEYPSEVGKVEQFHWSKMPKWATFAMDNRDRGEGWVNQDYVSGNGQVYDETRLRGSLEVKPDKHFLFYAQFMDDHALALPPKHTANNQRDAFDLRQGYLQGNFDVGDSPASIEVGRRELKFGQQRLIGISNFTNNSRTFDGFFAQIGPESETGHNNRIDFFSSSVVKTYPTSLDNHGAGLQFHGVYVHLNSMPHISLQPYLTVHREPSVKSVGGVTGQQNTVTTGFEALGSFPGWMHHFDYDTFNNFQRGSWSTESIRSGATIQKLAYTAEELPWVPRIGGEFDYSTGNNANHKQQWSTYDQNYPSNHNAFGLTDLFGFQNIREERINLDLTPVNGLHLLIQQNFLNVSSKTDGVYNGGATEFIKPKAGGFASTDLGKEFDASAKYALHNYFVLEAGIGQYTAGALMHENAHGSDQTYAYLSLTHRFQVTK